MYLFRRELSIIKKLDHPYIVKFFECYEDDVYFHLVMEYCDGGELLNRISSRNTMSETDAKRIMKNIVIAVDYLHRKGICHRDLKPENFLFKDKSKNSVLKLVDFGFSYEFESMSCSMNSLVGSPLYVAPEVLLQKYDYRCDIWSLGVILYVILSGKPPFTGKNQQILFNKILKGNYDFTHEVWKKVSDSAKDLIQKLMNPNKKKRLTTKKILQHSWMAENKKKIEFKYAEQIKRFRCDNKLKKIAFRLIFELIDSKENDKLSKQFIEETDCNNISFFNYYYFNWDPINVLTKDILSFVFDYFDTDKSGIISADDIESIFIRIGKKVNNEEIISLIKNADKKENGGLDFENFCELLVE